MCASPNTNTNSQVLFTNVSQFNQENDLVSLSLTLDELFSGYLDSSFCEADETSKVDRFQDYLKLKALLKIIE